MTNANITYGIDDGHSNLITTGLSEREVQGAAQREANALGKTVYYYRETRSEQEIADEVYADSIAVSPEIDPDAQCSEHGCARHRCDGDHLVIETP